MGRGILGVAATLLCAWLAVGGCAKKDLAPEDDLLARNEFVGSAACTECHNAQASTHATTRHALTLRDMTPAGLGSDAPPEGPIPGTDYALHVRDGRFWVGLTKDPKKTDSIDLAFGSGKNGLTFASVMGNALAEVRMSYEPRTKRWFLTPGQEDLKDRKLGKVHRGDFARRCVLCHGVALPDERALPDPKLFGVGCESCHGAGGDHLKAMRAGRTSDLRIGRLSQASAAEVNAVCDRCHTTGQPSTPFDLEMSEASTRRFPLYGLKKSACFLKSDRKLSCLHCHDPHSASSHDLTTFEAACRRCHGTSSPTPEAGTMPPGVPARHCPVNATTGCIDCHMPQGLVMPESQSHAKVRDHFIRIHKK